MATGWIPSYVTNASSGKRQLHGLRSYERLYWNLSFGLGLGIGNRIKIKTPYSVIFPGLGLRQESRGVWGGVNEGVSDHVSVSGDVNYTIALTLLLIQLFSKIFVFE